MEVTILVDVGEVRSRVPDELRKLGMNVVVGRLPCGDYQFGGREVVERETVADLHRSIATGRLWRQLEKIRRDHERGWLLVEGYPLDAGQLSAGGVRGALLAVVDTGVPLLWSSSARDSAYLLTRLAARARRRASEPGRS